MPSLPDSGLRLAGTGAYLPARILSNHDLEKLVETSDEWIFTRTGIKERRIASEKETSTFMGVAAARQALAGAKIQAKDLDLILAATVTPESFFPSTACRISAELGASGCPALDVQAACSGFVYALILANQFLSTGTAKKHSHYRHRAPFLGRRLAGSQHLCSLWGRCRSGGSAAAARAQRHAGV